MNADVGGGGLIKRLDNGNQQRKLNIGADNFKFFRSCADLLRCIFLNVVLYYQMIYERKQTIYGWF